VQMTPDQHRRDLTKKADPPSSAKVFEDAQKEPMAADPSGMLPSPGFGQHEDQNFNAQQLQTLPADIHRPKQKSGTKATKVQPC